MTGTQNIFPVGPNSDGVKYAVSTPITTTEADLFNQAAPNPDPIPVIEGQACFATVVLTAQGGVLLDNSYVVMQTDLGDGNWIDVAWIVWTGLSGSAVFALSGGVAGSNGLQQTRAAGTAPSSNGSNQIPLGGRVRFVGKATLTLSGSSGSSISPGLEGQVTASIRYKLLGLR